MFTCGPSFFAQASGGGGPSDPYWASVASLLHLDGSSGSTTFTDQKGLSWSAMGGAVLNTSTFKFGSASLACNGISSAAQNSTALAVGSGDFTIEGWLYPTSLSSVLLFFDQRPASTNGLYPALYLDSSGNIHFFVANGDVLVQSSGGLATNIWTHVALSRVSGTTRLFTAGVSRGSVADTNNYLASRTLIGQSSFNTGATSFTGYIDDWRITIGVGRYTSNFTPPTAAFPDH